MKISISNFKAIREIRDFSLENINILTGVNSGGKSSLIHLLLLIKQSLEFRSTESPLKLNRPYVALGKFENILRKGEGADSIKLEFVLEPSELVARLKRLLSQKGNLLQPGEHQVKVEVEFAKPSDRIVVKRFRISCNARATHDSSLETVWLETIRNSHGKSYSLRTNNQEVFFQNQDPSDMGDLPSIQVGFFSFFPDYFVTQDGNYVSSFLIDQVRLTFQRIFARISYIGPLREEPKDFYFQDDDQIDHIGNKGENAAYILAKHANDLTSYHHLNGEDIKPCRLEDAVNYWLCNVFNLGREIHVETSKGNRYLYTVSLTGQDGIKVPITHVGFGVSQIFPILVEALRPSHTKRIIILEQPEIHLHPKVQSLLFDFFLATKDTVSYLVETHSDHLITRLRRRIAEECSDELLNLINLTFVEPGLGHVEYSKLRVDSIGHIDDWPDGFFDQHESELRALVVAQMQKRRGRS